MPINIEEIEARANSQRCGLFTTHPCEDVPVERAVDGVAKAQLALDKARKRVNKCAKKRTDKLRASST